MSLFVGNLPTGVKEDDLKQKFNNGRFAFVEFDREVDAHEAIKRYNGRELNGNIIVVEMSKNSRGGPSRQKEGRQRSRSRSPRSQQSSIIQLSQNEEPPALAQIPWGKKDSPPVQNHTNQTPDAENKIEETPKAPEVQLSIPAPPTFAPKAQTETADLTLLQTDSQDAVSVSSMHVEVASMLSQTSDAAEEPKANDNEPMDIEEAKANENEPMEIEENVTEEMREEVKVVPSSLETHSPHKATTLTANLEVQEKLEEKVEKAEENPEERIEEKIEDKPEEKPEEKTEGKDEEKIEEKNEPVQQPQAPENEPEPAEEAKETEHIYKEGDEFEAADGSKFRIVKVNPKHDDATQVHCLRCNRSIQKKSVKTHITTKVHKGL